MKIMKAIYLEWRGHKYVFPYDKIGIWLLEKKRIQLAIKDGYNIRLVESDEKGIITELGFFPY